MNQLVPSLYLLSYNVMQHIAPVSSKLYGFISTKTLAKSPPTDSNMSLNSRSRDDAQNYLSRCTLHLGLKPLTRKHLHIGCIIKFGDLHDMTPPSFLRSFLPSFLPSFVPSFLLSFLPSFLSSFLLFFFPSFLLSNVSDDNFEMISFVLIVGASLTPNSL